MKSHWLLVILVLVAFVWSAFPEASAVPQNRAHKIADSSIVDYQPAMIRMEPSGDLMVVFERLTLPSFAGDLYVTFSSDQGMTWTTPQPAVATSANERHPSLLQLGADSYVLFYLSQYDGYRIHRATSSDGTQWITHGAVDLGWTIDGEINPCVIRETNGTLTMTYHRLSGPCYIAQSTDNGVTWDTLKTQVSPSNGQLPRLAKREFDNRYVVTYQTGSLTCYMWAKTSTDPYDWSAPAVAFDTVDNSHDSQPIVLEGGTFLVTYARASTGYFDVCYRTGYNGKDWSEPVQVTHDDTKFDTQPHPLSRGIPGHVFLLWSHQESLIEYIDHDVWIEPDLEIPLPLWLDTDSIPASAGGVVEFYLDAGVEKANRNYLMLSGATGTEPGFNLPGGGAHMPLNRDSFTRIMMGLMSTPYLTKFIGALDAQGRAVAVLDTNGSLPPTAVGAVLYFAYCLGHPWEFASNPQAVTIAP